MLETGTVLEMHFHVIKIQFCQWKRVESMPQERKKTRKRFESSAVLAMFFNLRKPLPIYNVVVIIILYNIQKMPLLYIICRDMIKIDETKREKIVIGVCTVALRTRGLQHNIRSIIIHFYFSIKNILYNNYSVYCAILSWMNTIEHRTHLIFTRIIKYSVHNI